MDRVPHILVIDDDSEIRRLLKRYLTDNGLRATVGADGAALMAALEDWHIDLLVLDIMLPGEDGFALCRRIRETTAMPIVMLTAMSKDSDRIMGLELGADDYVVKPFNPRELLARIRAVLRRTDRTSEPAAAACQARVLRFRNWEVNTSARELRAADGTIVHLSTGEYSLLLTFLANAERPLSRDQLADMVRGQTNLPFDRSIDIQVSRLRRKIEPDPKEPTLIKTVRGIGYQFCVPVDGQ